MENNTEQYAEQIKVLAEIFNTDKIVTPDQIEQVLEAILNILVRFKKENQSLNDDTKKQVESITDGILKEHDRILASVEKYTQNVKSEATEAVTKALEEVKRIAKEVLEAKPKDGDKGEDADEDEIVEKVLGKIKLPENKEFLLTGEDIVDNINALSLDAKNLIDASHIKNLPTPKSGFSPTVLGNATDLNQSARADGYAIVWDDTNKNFKFAASGGGGGSGTVTSVAATVPTGLTISGSPITAAGTLAIGLDTGYVIPLQSTLDAKVPYTGATANVDLGTYDLITDTITAKSSAGLLLENASGGDVLHIGSGGGVNATAYGGWNFDGATANTIASFGASKTLTSLDTATYPSLTELSYVKGVTSAIQTQLNAKVDDGAVTTSGLTMSTARILGRTTASTGAIEELSTVDSFVSAASDTTAGKIEVATTAETNTGTDATRAVSPDGLAGSYAGTKSVSIAVFAPTTDVATGDGKAYITIPEALNGMNLVRAQATVVTAGTTNATTVMIYNVTQTADMLSGAISIASGGTVGTVGTIDTGNDDVATNDVLRIDVDSVSTTAPKGLMIVLEFRLP